MKKYKYILIALAALLISTQTYSLSRLQRPIKLASNLDLTWYGVNKLSTAAKYYVLYSLSKITLAGLGLVVVLNLPKEESKLVHKKLNEEDSHKILSYTLYAKLSKEEQLVIDRRLKMFKSKKQQVLNNLNETYNYPEFKNSSKELNTIYE